MLLMIDNYDSFTYNLVHYLGELGAETVVHRNDALTVDDAMALQPDGIVISPGPCDPERAGICLDLIKAAAGNIPLMGVCLGLQSIGQAFGGKIIRLSPPMHGKVSTVTHDNRGVFKGLNSKVPCTRYHSLVVEKESLPDCLEVTAETEDGVIMGLQHRDYELHGVQFHPESIASEGGHTILQNFINITKQ
ncbi:anthranilate synthase component II [Curvivirga aplysinae]|uniref:anthranilate synthase component II n=1 Tax=Curvivirga aplysinae TaxID=2529852 RepID=UPI0012BB8E75|nr:aminodeoxychorismate/anthranilate synthase component II [Curvivirga aplysinae]MTI09099.1 aminodeoxychorismate/anthranilate synthase component II [Curvivirga aplysinae]